VSAPADPVAETGADPASHAAPVALVDEAQTYLLAAHDVRDPPLPLGSAYRYWGSDPRLAGWHYWRAGVSSWDVKARIPQPDHSLPVYLCGEAWSTSQAWVEGSLESAISVVERLA
jgi:hypothetical protein